ncbi:TonB-dependent receptor [Sandaracinobacteroides saxicola]|uniref:TonB-dependent receptor n=1 Tax=Sandaracinobacteroides saxicola TaxID=2759707 RepID=A0A7G5IDL9_9SPHN|nr:TonB-dependent receptor [Sandaracinobacteroides saxicola]QMW21461.1 TonB-dependent receptor [Sandaracinobacteroides saxicola]
MRHPFLIAGLLATTAMPAPLFAQAAAVAVDEGDIIVTARRQSERLQDVPASVSVLTEATLSRAGVVNAAGIAQLTPGVTIVTNTAEIGDTQINIRGINGARDAESSVALVVDGILKTNTSVLNQMQGDLTQVEVLKGPQGAYYGRNAAAGALAVTTRKPGDMFEARGRVSGGNNATWSGFVSLSGPLSDTVSLLVSGDYRRTDGFFRNTGPIAVAQGATVDQYEGYGFNARLIADLSDRSTLDVKARYSKVKSGSINFNVAFALPNTAAAFGSPAFFENVNDHPFLYQSNIPSAGNQKTFEASAKFDHDLGAAKLTAWALYSDVKQDLIADAAVAAFGFFNSAPECRASVAALTAAGFQLAPPAFLAGTPEASILGAFGPTTCDGTQYQLRNQRDFSAEVRLASTAGGPLDWSVGAYYLNINREVGVSLGYDKGQGILPNLFNGRTSSNPTEQLAHDRFRTDVFALFGSGDYKLAEPLTLSVALRYDRELRRVTNLVDPTARNQYARGGNKPLNVGLDFGPLLPQRAVYEQLQPRVSLSWKASDEVNLYASWGVGFKSGGFNNQGSKATIESAFNAAPINAGLNIDDRFRKERSSAFEAGFKATAFDGRLRLDGAVYHSEIKDLQFFEFYAGPFGILRVVSNIDKARVTGGELEATVQVMPGWSLFASGNVNDGKIVRNTARPGTNGGKLPYTSDYTINLGTDVSLPLSDTLKANFRADYRIVGPTWFSTAQTGQRPTLFKLFLPGNLGTGDYGLTRREAYGTLDLRAGVSGANWSLTAYAANVANRKYLAEVIPAPEFGGSFISPGGRRSFGLEAGFNF